MGMLPADFKAANVEAVSMCTYSNDSAKPFIQHGKAYDVFSERLVCLAASFGSEAVRVGLGQGIPSTSYPAGPGPSWNPRLSELKRQLSRIEAANLSRLAVFVAPTLGGDLELYSQTWSCQCRPCCASILQPR
jgi:hypothetical protein